jgi:hypothetical protein
LGEKSIRTLRLHQEARGKLLDDFRRLPRSTDTVAREWENWLKGGQLLAVELNVTFKEYIPFTEGLFSMLGVPGFGGGFIGSGSL